MSLKKFKQGISVIEILIVIGIMGIVASLTVSGFHLLANTESLDKEAELVLSYINRTRTNAINSLDLQEHGIVFASSSVRIYYGNNPSAVSTSTTYNLAGNNVIQNLSLSNHLTSLYFYKLSGEPSATGTIRIRNSDGEEKVIVIYGTGLSEVQ